MPAPLATARNKLLARLHCIRRDQGWSEDEYRDILEARTGRRSAGDLDERTIARLVASLDPKAAQKSAAAGRRHPPHEWTWVDTAPEHKRSKLRKLIMLAKGAGIAKGRQVAWIEGIALRMAGVAGAGPIEKPLVDVPTTTISSATAATYSDVTFKPSKKMLDTTHPRDWLEGYMREREPDVTLILPQEKLDTE